MVPSLFAFVVNEHPSGILWFWTLIESKMIVFVWFPLPSGSSNKWNTLKTTDEGTWHMTDYVHVHDCLLLWRLQKKHPRRPSNKTYHPYNNRMQPWNILTYPILSQMSLYHQPQKTMHYKLLRYERKSHKHPRDLQLDCSQNGYYNDPCWGDDWTP